MNRSGDMVTHAVQKRGRPSDIVLVDTGARENLAEVVTRNIRRDVIAGRFRQGQRIPELHLAELYGVSRNPVREAIRRLEAEGFVTISPNRGATVAILDLAEANDLLETRLAIESLVVRQAAWRCTSEDVEALRAIIAKGKRAVRSREFRTLAELNTRFHARLAQASDNMIAQGLVDQLRDKTTWVYSTKVTNNKRASTSWKEHADLVEALEKHDPEQAVLTLQRHIMNAARNYRPRYELPES
jgi:DNA-binding GntR family transcriptional regulator